MFFTCMDASNDDGKTELGGILINEMGNMLRFFSKWACVPQTQAGAWMSKRCASESQGAGLSDMCSNYTAVCHLCRRFWSHGGEASTQHYHETFEVHCSVTKSGHKKEQSRSV